MCEIYLKHSPDARCGYCKEFINNKLYCKNLKKKVNPHTLGCPDYCFCQQNYEYYNRKCEKCVYFQEYSQVTGEIICGLYGLIVTGVCKEYKEEW